MKITVRVYQETNEFQVDAEASDTIGDLKAKIHESQGYPTEKQSILFCARVPTDDRTLESCRISDKGFIVLLISKPRLPMPEPVPVDISEFRRPSAQDESPSVTAPLYAPSEAISAPVPATVSASTPNSDSTRVLTPPSARLPALVPTPAPAPTSTSALLPAPAPVFTLASAVSTATTPTPTPSDGSVITGLQTSINSMVELGFPRDQVQRALKASFNNPDRALEYLLSGVPAHLEVQSDSPASVSPTGRPPNSSQVDELRTRFTQSPELVQAVTQHLAVSNPELAQLFAQNPEMLLRFLNAIGEEGCSAQTINTEEERAAIERLEALGFPRQAVIEAYLACDKNERLATNYLVEGGS